MRQGGETAQEMDKDVVGTTDLEPAWDVIRAGLRRDIGVRLFDQWLRPLKVGSFCVETGTLDMFAPSEFSANYVASSYGARLRLAWRAAGAGVGEVRVLRTPNAVEAISVARTAALSEQRCGNASGTPDAGQQRAAPTQMARFEPRHDFASFVTDESNALACSAARAMAAMDSPRFSPLFIHGATGLGKTHLLHAIAGEFAELRGGTLNAGDILYMSAERFMMEFVSAIRANDTMIFKARLRAAKLLLIDDIQFIAGKGPTQEEFLHTVNALFDAGARIVITADRAPQQLGAVDPRILSRFSGGLVADIQPAGLELRLAILKARCDAVAPIVVPDAVVELLGRSIRSSIREMEGAFNKLVAYAQLMDKAITLDLAQSMLAEAIRANARRITIDEIQKACAAHYRIDASEMRSQRRARAVARPRQIAMYLAKKLTPRSLPEIGRIFGGRDHSTVIHAVRTIEAMRQENPDMDADIRNLQRQLES